jgi:hypothetical protein
MHRFALTGLLLLLAAPGWAEETPYDLRQRYTPQVGDVVEIVELDRTVNGFKVLQQGQEVEKQVETVGAEQACTEEALRVSGTNVVDFRRTYARFKDLAKDEEHPVEGLVVTYVEDEGGTTTWTAPEGATVPPALKAVLDEDAGESVADEGAERDKLLAAEPVFVGQTWDIPLDFVATQFGLDPRDLVEDASSARGTLTEVETEGEIEYRKVLLEIELATSKFQGMHCPEPLRFSMRVTIRLSPHAPYGSSELTGTVKGQAVPPDMPPGVLVDLDTRIERREVRQAPR